MMNHTEIIFSVFSVCSVVYFLTTEYTKNTE